MNNPGKLDRRITIQRRMLTKDNTGSRIETWTDLSPVWAQYVISKGNESAHADAEVAIQTQQFRIRWRDINSTDHRIVYRSRVYDITGVTEEGRRDTLLIDSTATQSTT